MSTLLPAYALASLPINRGDFSMLLPKVISSTVDFIYFFCIAPSLLHFLSKIMDFFSEFSCAYRHAIGFTSLNEMNWKLLLSTICPQTSASFLHSPCSNISIKSCLCPFSLVSKSNSSFFWWSCLYLVFFFLPNGFTLECTQSTVFRTLLVLTSLMHSEF